MIEPEAQALCGYRVMWLFVMFDLPTETKKQRKDASIFRKDLMKDGFVMHQFSVYIRHCASLESANVHINRVKGMVPDEGFVSIVKITDVQYGQTINFTGKLRKPPPQEFVQLELF